MEQNVVSIGKITLSSCEGDEELENWKKEVMNFFILNPGMEWASWITTHGLTDASLSVRHSSHLFALNPRSYI